MAAKLEKLDANKAKLTVEVSPEDFEKGVNQVYQKQKGKFNIPGFRKGKAPRVIIENFYGPQVFFEDAFEEVFPDAYKAAVEEHKLEVVSRPENVDIVTLSQEEGVAFTAEVTLKPEVKLGKYKGIKATRDLKKITAKDVDAEIEKIRDQNGRWVETDRAAKDGDTVIVDYSGSVGGVKFDGGTAEGQSLVLGSKRFIPGFEEQVVGMKKGAGKDVFVKFPEDYTPELAGKDAVFTVTVREVKEKELPALDDDFAQDVSEFDTLAEYKKDLAERMQKQAEDRAKIDIENQVLQALSKDAKMDVPGVMVESQVDYQIQDMQYRLMYQGIKLESYLEYMGNTMEELRESYRESAEQQVRMRLAVEALRKELDIEPTEEDVQAKLEELAKEAGKSVEDYKKTMSDEELDQFAERVAMERVFGYLVEHAEIKEKSAKKASGDAQEKAAAKKPAAGKAEAAKKSAEKAGEKPAAKAVTEKKPAAKSAEKKDAKLVKE